MVAPPTNLHYGADLAAVHHEHFGGLARSAARELITQLSLRRISSGTVLDLAAGTGILSRCMIEAGFVARGVDISEDMLRIARTEAPTATFDRASLWDVELPSCVAVAAIGEAFNYAADPAAGLPALEKRLVAIERALSPGGLLLFDVASPGRSGPSGLRHAFWAHERVCLGMQEREDPHHRSLTRTITLFVPEDGRYRRVEESHTLVLYSPEEVETGLTRAGLTWKRLGHYDELDLSVGWNAYIAENHGPSI